mmetsp:Transcript_5793/g.18412  ORF Transcript_5793/g.18412 Transcript_5793/m.18412 type:complete len:273 (+) Transcript_5793:640-1458(+)
MELWLFHRVAAVVLAAGEPGLDEHRKRGEDEDGHDDHGREDGRVLLCESASSVEETSDAMIVRSDCARRNAAEKVGDLRRGEVRVRDKGLARRVARPVAVAVDVDDEESRQLRLAHAHRRDEGLPAVAIQLSKAHLVADGGLCAARGGLQLLGEADEFGALVAARHDGRGDGALAAEGAEVARPKRRVQLRVVPLDPGVEAALAQARTAGGRGLGGGGLADDGQVKVHRRLPGLQHRHPRRRRLDAAAEDGRRRHREGCLVVPLHRHGLEDG